MWCLYLPGICIHAVPATVRPGSGELHIEVDPFPATFKFQPVQNTELPETPRAEPLPPPSPLNPIFSSAGSVASVASHVPLCHCCYRAPTKLTFHKKAFENTSTSVAASQMRNALTALADTVKDPHQKEVGSTRKLAHGLNNST